MAAWPGSEKAISVADAARLTGASSKSLRRRIERGTLGSVRQGSRRLIPIGELVRAGLLDPSTGRSPAPAPAFPGARRPETTFRAAPRFSSGQPPTTPRPAPAPVPGPRPSPLVAAGTPPPGARGAPASAPQLRAPWARDTAPGTPREPGAPRFPARSAGSSPRVDAPPATPAASSPPPAPAAATASPASATPRSPDRRVAAILQLVMHQTRTITALNARLTRLEERMNDLLGPID